MKKIQLMICLGMLLTSACIRAQNSPGSVVFKTADGKIIPANKLDSVKKALGEFTYRHSDKEPGVMYLIAKSSAAQKAAAASKARFAALIGKPAPYFNLTDIDGKKYDLKQLKGKVVVLNFWFITCAGCIAEMPYLNQVKAAYKGQQVIFLGLGLEKAAQIREFKKTHKFDYAIIPETLTTAQNYGLYTYPVSMVINRAGLISTIIESDQPIESLPVAINAAIKTVSK